MASKILITDAFSSLGQAIYSAFEHSPYSVLTPTRSKLDLQAADAAALVDYIRRHDVAVIINTFGWSEEPTVEDQRALVTVAGVVAKAASETGCIVMHISSYRVFGGENKSSYDEEDVPSPLSTAGEAFLQAESLLSDQLQRLVCLRLSWVIDTLGDSIFSSLLGQLSTTGPELQVTHQRRGAPVSTMEVGWVLLGMVNQLLCGADNWGVFHLASSDTCTSAEFVEALADVLEREGELRRQWQLQQLSTAQLETQQEPDSSVLTVRRCRDNFGYQARSWRQGLTAQVRSWLQLQKRLQAEA
ncbi:sugar nucleotide-binding protein [Pseudomaricurvus sp. HS19]|uniref:sugar nucleotide-binding protein n=1 Tax=Pseudomaricurvus sp. HS19 TaxID=2692626 RepID=UPI00136DDCEC|nr:sugar nucleotide-binding protein [Pseudomaricurvus sp. HS19]